jgi:hypothetical protein
MYRILTKVILFSVPGTLGDCLDVVVSLLMASPQQTRLYPRFLINASLTPTWRQPGLGQAKCFATSSSRTVAMIDLDKKLHRALQP